MISIIKMYVGLAGCVSLVYGVEVPRDVLKTPCNSVETFFGFPQALETIRHAETIRVALLGPAADYTPEPTSFMENQARELGGADRERMGKILLSADTYVWPQPAVIEMGEVSLGLYNVAIWHARVRAIKGTDVVNIDFSFPGYVNVWFNGTMLRYSMLGPGGRQVIAMLDEYFPREIDIKRHEKLWTVLRGDK